MFNKLFSKAEKKSYHNGVRAGINKCKTTECPKSKHSNSFTESQKKSNYYKSELKRITNSSNTLGLSGKEKSLHNSRNLTILKLELDNMDRKKYAANEKSFNNADVKRRTNNADVAGLKGKDRETYINNNLNKK